MSGGQAQPSKKKKEKIMRPQPLATGFEFFNVSTGFNWFQNEMV
jgi:hypothetical protein